MGEDQVPDPYQYDPYAALPDQQPVPAPMPGPPPPPVGGPPPPVGGPPPARRTHLHAVIAVLSIVVVAMAAGVAWLLLRDGGSASEAAPAPATSAPVATTTAPTPEPDEQPVGDVQATANQEAAGGSVTGEASEATGFVTAAAEGGATEETTAPATGPRLDQAAALAGLDRYLGTVVADPAAGWEMLTPERQARESYADYVDWWGSLTWAEASGCRYDESAQRAVCDLRTTSLSGMTGITRDVGFTLAERGGVVLIDTDAGAIPHQAAALQRLQEIRDESRYSVFPDGRWVAILSAKRDGISDPLQVAANGTNTFHYADILAMHEALSLRLPGAHVFMLHSEDFGRQTGQNLWFTIADAGFSSEGEVDSWCARSFPELQGESLHNQCLARNLNPPTNP